MGSIIFFHLGFNLCLWLWLGGEIADDDNAIPSMGERGIQSVGVTSERAGLLIDGRDLAVEWP